MALPSFTVTGNLFEITGDTTASVLDETAPTTYRVTFTTNLNPVSDLVVFNGSLYKIDIVYAAIGADGSLEHATMEAGGVLTPDGDPIVLVAANGLSVTNLQYRFQLEKPQGTGWQALTSFWFDAPTVSGGTIDLADVVPVAGTDRFRGPRADVVDGYYDDAGDLVLVNVDGSYTNGITPLDGVLVFVDNGDGTWTI